MKKSNQFIFIAVVMMLSIGLIGLITAKAATKVSLGAADNFAVIAGSTITNTGSSVINGDLGLNPGTSVTGFPAGIINGTQQIANANAIDAQLALTAAYLNAANQTPVSTIPTELGGTTKTPGIYDSAAGTFSITGTLTLDGEGNPDAVFIFKTASTLITDGASSVVLINGAQACNVFWQVGSSATLGTNSIFKGNILTLTSATLTTGANVEGRVLSRNGAVTLNASTVTKAVCAVPTPAPAPVVIVEPVVVPVVVPVSTTTSIIIPVATSTPVITATPVLISENIMAPIAIPSFPSTGFGPESSN